jgi:hypothetical protein
MEVWKFLDCMSDNYHLKKDSFYGIGLVGYDGRITVHKPLSHWNIPRRKSCLRESKEINRMKSSVNKLTYKCTMRVKLKPQQ